MRDEPRFTFPTFAGTGGVDTHHGIGSYTAIHSIKVSLAGKITYKHRFKTTQKKVQTHSFVSWTSHYLNPKEFIKMKLDRYPILSDDNHATYEFLKIVNLI
jgi:hypothetical protein